MSDPLANIVTTAEMKPSSASEKLARFQLLKAQIEAREHPGSDLEKVVLGNMSEEELIRLDVLKTIVNYKESTPEWFQLCAMTKGRTDPFDQAEYLAHEIYETQKAEIMLSYYTPSKQTVRGTFLASAKTGSAKRTAAISDIESRDQVKASIAARAAAALTGGGAAASRG